MHASDYFHKRMEAVHQNCPIPEYNTGSTYLMRMRRTVRDTRAADTDTDRGEMR